MSSEDIKKFLEVEFKYSADSISLTEFSKFCKNRLPKKEEIVSGFDYFYANPKVPDAFCRHRQSSETNQLTFKRKTQDKNNFVRTEDNMDLMPFMTQAQVQTLCANLGGYLYDYTIFKNCFIFTYERYTLVYYICYNPEMKELGRFIEIEMSEKHPWISEEETYNELLIMEKICAKDLGISAQARIKRSLWEMFKK